MQVKRILLATLFTGLVSAQVQSPGRFHPDPFEESRNLHEPKGIFKVPKLNNTLLRLMAESDHTGPYKFGEAMPITVDMAGGDGQWTREEDGGVRKWRALIQSEGAKSISVLFDDFYLPPDAEFYVIGEQYVLGAYTGAVNNKPDGKFAIQPVMGQAVMLEYIEPIVRDDPDDKPRIKVAKAVHGFRAMQVGESGPCNIDVKCPLGAKWRKQIDSVAVMITDQGQRFCSGAMINNAAQDGAQYFLTASHCVYTDVSFFILGFNYQYSACRSGGQQAALQMPQTVQGLSLVAQYNSSDFALFLVREKIPDAYNVYLAGWDNRKIAPKSVAGIHHPSGDAKKISTYDGLTKSASWAEGNLQFHWEIPFWLYGATELGSSGSPLFSDKGLLVGQLHGGRSSCDLRTGYDMYGTLWADWSAVKNSVTNSVASFLNPTKQQVQAIPGKYLKDIPNRKVPQVVAIKPLYKAPRPRMMGPVRPRAATEEDVIIQPEDLATTKMEEADLVIDVSDEEPLEQEEIKQSTSGLAMQNQVCADAPTIQCRMRTAELK